MKANKSKQYKILSPYEQQVFTLRVDKQDRQKNDSRRREPSTKNKNIDNDNGKVRKSSLLILCFSRFPEKKHSKQTNAMGDADAAASASSMFPSLPFGTYYRFDLFRLVVLLLIYYCNLILYLTHTTRLQLTKNKMFLSLYILFMNQQNQVISM